MRVGQIDQIFQLPCIDARLNARLNGRFNAQFNSQSNYAAKSSRLSTWGVCFTRPPQWIVCS